jgi:PAS domain S-box-containing protein
VFAVAAKSSAKAVTLDQLADIYAGRTVSWPDGSPIRPVLRQVGDDNTEQIKRMSPALDKAMDVAHQRQGMAFATSDQEAGRQDRGHSRRDGQHGLEPHPVGAPALRALAVNGVEATAANGASGAYPYVKRFFFIASPQQRPAAAGSSRSRNPPRGATSSCAPATGFREASVKRGVDRRITSIVTRVALLVASAVSLALPLGYWFVTYDDFSIELAFKARVKATALSEIIAANPDLWMYAENHLQALLTRRPVPLEDQQAEIYDAGGKRLARAGPQPAAPVLSRSHPLYDSSRVVGRVEVSDSLRPAIYGTAIAALIGALLGGATFAALRTFPLRALRRAMEALSEQKERAEVTLQSIGDAVVTTDAGSRVAFLNPVAERLSGWSEAEARGRPLAEILPMCDAESGERLASPLDQALAEDRIVSFQHDTDLVRRDGSRIASTTAPHRSTTPRERSPEAC